MTIDANRLAERLAAAGISQESWASVTQRYRSDERLRDARPEIIADGLAEVARTENFAAIADVKALLSDDRPVWTEERGGYVFEVRMLALSTLQNLAVRAPGTIDFGPVTVAKGMSAAQLDQALKSLSLPESELEDAMRHARGQLGSATSPHAPALGAYRLLQDRGEIEYHVEHVDSDTCATPFQEALFASQVASEPARPCARVMTKRTGALLGWIYVDDSQVPRGRFSQHPLAQRAQEDVAWALRRDPSLIGPASTAQQKVERLASFLDPDHFTVTACV